MYGSLYSGQINLEPAKVENTSRSLLFLLYLSLLRSPAFFFSVSLSLSFSLSLSSSFRSLSLSFPSASLSCSTRKRANAFSVAGLADP